MFARIGNVKAGKFAAEGEDMENLNDIETVLGSLNIRIRETNSDMRDASDIFEEVAGRWATFSEVERNAVATAMAGTRQRENFIVLMSNFDKTLALTTDSMNSLGTAENKMSAYNEGLEASLAKLTASWERLILSFKESDIINFFVKFAGAITDVVVDTNALAWAIGALAVKGISVLIKNISSSITKFAELSDRTRIVAGTIKEMGKFSTIGAQEIQGLQETLKGLTAQQQLHILTSQKLNKEQILQILTEKNLSKADYEYVVSQLAVKNAQAGTAITSATLSTAFKGLTASIWGTIKATLIFLATNPVGWAISAVAILGGVALAYSAINVTIDEQREKVAELTEEYSSQKTVLENLNSELETSISRMKELENIDVGKRTLVEEEELEKLRETVRLMEVQQQIEESKLALANKKLLTESVELVEKQNKSKLRFKRADSESNASFEEYSDYDKELSNVASTKKKIEDAMIELENETTENGRESWARYIKELDTKLSKYETKLSTSAKDAVSTLSLLNEVPEAKRDSAWNESFNLATEMVDRYYKTLSKTEQKKYEFDKVMSDSNYSGSVKELQKVAKTTGLTKESFDEIASTELKAFFYDSSLSIEDFVKELNLAIVASGKLSDENENLNEGLAALSDNYTLLKNVEKEINEERQISASTLDSIISKYPLMQEYIDDYILGLIDEKELLHELENAYIDDQNSYLESSVSKLQTNTKYYNKIKENAELYLKNMGIIDKTDLENIKTLADAKGKVWEYYYNQIQKMAKESISSMGGPNLESMYNEMWDEDAGDFNQGAVDRLRKSQSPAFIEAYNTLLEYKNALNGLNDITYEPLEASLNSLSDTIDKTFSDKTSKLSSSAKDAFKEGVEEQIGAQKHLYDTGKISATEYYNELERIINKYYKNNVKYIDDFRKYEADIYKARQKMIEDSIKQQKEALVDAQKAYNDLLKITIDYLKKQKELEKERLEDELRGYKQIIDKRKQLIDMQNDERKHQKDISERNKSIAEKEARLLELANDNTAEAKAERLRIEEELAKEKSDLEDEQLDHSADKQKDALDKEYDEFEELQNKKISAIEDYINSSGQLSADAMELLKSRNSDLYNNLLEWNRQYGDGIDSTITKAWNAAYDALAKYGDKLNSIDSDSFYSPPPSSVNKPKPPYSGGGGGISSGGKLTVGSKVLLNGRVYGDSYGRDPGAMFNNYKGYITRYNPKGSKPYHVDGKGWVSTGDIVSTKHKGLDAGFVGNVKGNEEFVKALKGEAFITQEQQDKFMNKILPQMVSKSSNDGMVIDTLLEINVQGNLDKEVIPELKKVSTKVMGDINKVLFSRGYNRKTVTTSI